MGFWIFLLVVGLALLFVGLSILLKHEDEERQARRYDRGIRPREKGPYHGRQHRGH